ncbi:hypothetical protein [Microbispora catharanthi]|uniref:Uncharacterized protein n=1 Tax=Microbispora catharanthi TaxID=1712871 RepID=A0A5N6BZ59_9ACTN|nr:hypothetical protein [Microbispora catharanthi]KAB8185816.1 hypothetical protein FH610_008505 [Microbispora catharanthi]
MDTPSDLDRALEALYAAFSRYPLPAKTDVCDHCVSDERVRAARAAPLRMLTASALEPYAWNALYTWGDVEEFKHYLPRLLELLILEELDGLHSRSLMLHVGVRWQSWRKIEREAVIGTVGAWWRHTLAPGQLDQGNGTRGDPGARILLRELIRSGPGTLRRTRDPPHLEPALNRDPQRLQRGAPAPGRRRAGEHGP